MDQDKNILQFPGNRKNNNEFVDSSKSLTQSAVTYLLDVKHRREFDLTYEVTELVQEWGYDGNINLIGEILSIWEYRKKNRISITVYHGAYPATFSVVLDATCKYDDFRQSLYNLAAYFYSFPKNGISVQMVGGGLYRRS